MNTYEFHGSIRIEANSEDEALDILDGLQGCEIHINDMEEVVS